MNKSELIAAVAEKAGLKKTEAEKALAAFVETVSEKLAAGEKVQIVGFGTFEVKDRPARVAHNPMTKEPVEVPASKAPVFKIGKALKDAVNK